MDVAEVRAHLICPPSPPYISSLQTQWRLGWGQGNRSPTDAPGGSLGRWRQKGLSSWQTCSWSQGPGREHKGGLCSVPAQPRSTSVGLLSLQVPKGGSGWLRFKEVPLERRVGWREQTVANQAKEDCGTCLVTQVRNSFLLLVCGNGYHAFPHLCVKIHTHPATPTLDRYSPHTHRWGVQPQRIFLCIPSATELALSLQ